jgi:hypothetical protein
VPLQITLPPLVVRVVSPGPGWPTLLLTFLVGAATALAVQWVVQLYLVPKVETRKRREDRWERNVLELGDLLTTQLAERAHEAHVGQGLFRDLRELGTEPGIDQHKIAQSREQQAQAAQQATRAFEDLLSTRIHWLTGRIEKIAPKAHEITDFHEAASKYRTRTMIVQVRPQDDDRTDTAFDEAWEKERAARGALIKQVEFLADLPHPPRASRVRWPGR